MSALWGLPYLLIKVAVSELDPLFVVTTRLLLAAVVLVPIAAGMGQLKRARHAWKQLAAVATIGIVAPFLLIAYGEQHITSSLAALLIAADPLFIVLLALRIDASERASGTRLIGLILGFFGVAALVGFNPGGDAEGLLGSGMVLLGAICYAASALVVKRLPSGVPMLASSAVSLSIAGVLLVPLTLPTLPSHAPTAQAVLALLGLAIPCTAIAYVIYFHLIAEAGATRASLITYVNPAVAVILGFLVLGEPITIQTILGFALIILGCALSTGAADALIPNTPFERDPSNTNQARC
jgi:drug/metabolite transporter (DMT)-like permease